MSSFPDYVLCMSQYFSSKLSFLHTHIRATTALSGVINACGPA